MKLYDQFINESIKQYLKPKSEDSILNDILNSKLDYHLFINSCEHGFMKGVLFSFENLPDTELDNTIINWGMRRASYREHFDIVKYLIEEKGADLHDTNDYIFRDACEKGNIKMVKYLVEKGANINVNNSEYIRWRLQTRGKEYKEVLNYLIDLNNKRQKG